MAEDRLLTKEEFAKVINDAIEKEKFSIGIPKPEEIRVIIGAAQDAKTASIKDAECEQKMKEQYDLGVLAGEWREKEHSERIVEEIFREFEYCSRVIDWQEDLGKWRELPEQGSQSYQALKARTLKKLEVKNVKAIS